MSKSDEIRRMRERLYAQRERDTSPDEGAPAATHDADEPADEPAVVPERAPRAQAAREEQGRCTGCGKVRALVNGLVATHQKGLGKICPGSRKEPA